MSVKKMVRVCSILLCAAVTLPAAAGSISLRWNPVAGATGYKIYSGAASRSYDRVVDVGNTTSFSLSGLADCTDHYLTVKAYDSFGESAQYSNEISGWARPDVTSYAPIVADQGEQLTLNIYGANFAPSAELLPAIEALPIDELGLPLVRVENISVISCTQVQALLSVEPGARGVRAMEVGEFGIDFTIRNPDSVFGASSGILAIDFLESRADINRADASTRDRVDGKDLAWLTYSYGSLQGDSRYRPDSDQNGDGLVDGEDLVYVAVRFGRCWTGSAWSGASCS